MADTATHPGRDDRRSRYTIAHILPFPSVGGTEHATLRIAEAIDPEQFTNTVFCLREAEPVQAFVTNAGLPCVAYDAPVHSYLYGVAFFRSSYHLARELIRRKVDLVHCADLLAAYHAGLAGRLAGLPVLCQIRNRFADISRRDRSFLWPVHQFVFVSHDTWRRFPYRVSDKRGTVVYDGLDLPPGLDRTEDDRESVRREFNIPLDAPVIGMMARVAPQKDFATLARAAAAVLQVHPDARFLIAGDYAAPANREHYHRVQADLAACGVAGSFIFTGYRTDAARLLAAFDVFALSTHWEGLPLVILEAMARGIPVVATAVDGIPEIITDGETGLLFAHQDHERLASHIQALLQDRAGARRLGEAGRRLIGTTFSKVRFAERMNEVYASLLGEPPRGPSRS